MVALRLSLRLIVAVAAMMLLSGLMLATTARADDISAAARGVVRVVTIKVVDDEVVDFSHGSGFVVSPNRVVTNAHVVELAARNPENVVVGIVPSEGAKSYEGKIIALDAKRDLALIEFKGIRLPTLALYTGPLDEGGSVTALGYPGNVDQATAKSAADYIRPLSPIRSEGVFSGRRNLTDIEVLLHTASIARGNSGGPLLDPCGRVLGVNSALTRNEEGDSSFGFAIADTELTQFLRAAKQSFGSVGTACTSIADRLRQDKDADASAAAQAEATRIDALGKVNSAREQAIVQARIDAQRSRENYMAVAALLLVLASLGVSGAGFFELRGERGYAIRSIGASGMLLVLAIVTFFLRPHGDIIIPDAKPTQAPAVSSDAPIGKMVCTILPDRSRVTVSSTQDLALDWGGGGCMNMRTQYAENGSKWDRILVPAEEQTVSVLQFDPATRMYSNTRYLLSATQMDAARKIRSLVTLKACSPDIAARANLSTQQAAIRAALPPYPNEKIVYSCKAAP